jgi:hypothetical protein
MKGYNKLNISVTVTNPSIFRDETAFRLDAYNIRIREKIIKSFLHFLSFSSEF